MNEVNIHKDSPKRPYRDVINPLIGELRTKLVYYGLEPFKSAETGILELIVLSPLRRLSESATPATDNESGLLFK